MQEIVKIIVFLLEHLLHSDKPLFAKLKKVDIICTDDIRKVHIMWDFNKGARYRE